MFPTKNYNTAPQYHPYEVDEGLLLLAIEHENQNLFL